MITARSGDHACLWNFARQHVGKRAACLERSSMLKQFEFENDRDRVETNICAIDFENRCATDVWPDNALSCLNSLPREFASLSHRNSIHAKSPRRKGSVSMPHIMS